MPDGALNITLSDVVLSSTSVLSGTILHAIIGDPTLSALVSVLSGARLESRLDGASLSGGASVIAEASLSATIGSVSGQAFSVVRDGSTAPYEDVLSWTGHPLTGSRVRVRTGNLFGIFGELNEFGIFAGEGWDENSGTIPAWDSKYIRLGSFTNEFHNIPVKLYDDGDVTIQLEPDAPSFAMGNPIPSTYGTGIGLWQGKDSDDVYKWRVGDPSVGGSMLSWNGSSLSLVNSSLDIGGATAHIAFGDPPPTSPTSGTGIWIDRTGFYGVNAGVAQIFIDTLDGILYVDGGTEFGVNPLLGDLYVDGILTLGTDGRLQQGTGTWGVDFTGSAIWNDSGVMNIGGLNNNVKQWWGGSDGKLYAGGGDVILDDDGITINTPQYSADPSNTIKFNYQNQEFYSIVGYNAGNQVTHLFESNSGNPMIMYDWITNYGQSSITYEQYLYRQDVFDNQWVARNKFQLGGVSDTYFAYYINGLYSSNWNYKAGISGDINSLNGISELLIETTNYNATYTDKQASILIQANVKTPSSKIDLTADSINVIGNADISGNLVVDGTIKDGDDNEYGRPVFLTTPLTSTSWDGDARSTTSKTLIDLSSVFGVPAGVKAILAQIMARDSGSSSSATAFFGLSPNNVDGSLSLMNTTRYIQNDLIVYNTAIVPCTSTGDVYYQVDATGTGTMDCWIRIWGYWL